MLRFKRFVATLLLGTFAVVLAGGCMELSTAPVIPQQETRAMSGGTAQPEGLIGGLISVVDGLVRLVFRALTIVGNIGGSVSNGRWRVDVPAGAYDGTATVSIGISNSSSNSCQLEIVPAEKNHFATPVRLTMDCSGISSDKLKEYVILWFNPATREWVPVEGSTVDLSKKTVSAPLHHFSGYSCGPKPKAGW